MSRKTMIVTGFVLWGIMCTSFITDLIESLYSLDFRESFMAKSLIFFLPMILFVYTLVLAVTGAIDWNKKGRK